MDTLSKPQESFIIVNCLQTFGGIMVLKPKVYLHYSLTVETFLGGIVDSIFWEMLWMYLLSCQDLDEKTDTSLMQCILNSKLQHSLLSLAH